MAPEVSAVWSPAATQWFLPKGIVPVRISVWYRVGLLGVAGTLVLLQLVYIGMVWCMGWATVAYALRIPELAAEMQMNFFTVVLLATPLVAGAIATFFLFKPLLAGAPEGPSRFILKREEEPTLFDFVDRLCEVVGSPAPRQISVDLQMNASAGLRRGWMSLWTGDLELTLGLPLVAGLNLPQFAGVLAHEFGHFSQKAGMRLRFLIVSNQIWFSRVAYERDRWDEHLEQWREESGWRTKVVLGVAAAAVWLSRMILRGLLYVGGAVSAWFSRQMEYDADRHEASLVGAAVFGETMTRLAELGYAHHRAWQVMENAWLLRQIPENFPVLVHRIERLVEPHLREQLRDQALAEKTERWANHPCAADRLANVAGLAGIVPSFAPDEVPPASVLFENFGRLSAAATRHHYQVILGDNLSPEHIVEGEAFAEEKAREASTADAVSLLFPAVKLASRWFRLPEGESDGTPVEIRHGGEDPTAEYWRLLEQSVTRHSGVEFLRVGGRIEPAGFYLTSSDVEEGSAAAGQARAALAAEMERLREAYGARGYLMRDEAELRESYSALAREQEAVLELRHWWVAYRTLENNAQFVGAAESAHGREVMRGRMRGLYGGLIGRLREVGYPARLRHDRQAADVVSTLGVMGEPSEEDLVRQTGLLLDRIDVIGERLLGELCLLGDGESERGVRD